MFCQKTKYPNLAIPHSLHYLFQKLKEQGAKNESNLFLNEKKLENKLSIKLYIERLIHDNELEIKEEEVNFTAQVLIKFLKSADPLINFNQYKEFLSSNENNQYWKMWEKFPEINKQVLLHLYSFLQQISNHQNSKNLKLFSNIFSPFIVRNKVNNKKDSFTQDLISNFLSNFFVWMWENQSEKLIPIELENKPRNNSRDEESSEVDTNALSETEISIFYSILNPEKEDSYTNKKKEIRESKTYRKSKSKFGKVFFLFILYHFFYFYFYFFLLFFLFFIIFFYFYFIFIFVFIFVFIYFLFFIFFIFIFLKMQKMKKHQKILAQIHPTKLKRNQTASHTSTNLQKKT